MDTDNIDESSYDFARKKYRLIPADKVDDYEWLEKNRQERKDQAKLKEKAKKTQSKGGTNGQHKSKYQHSLELFFDSLSKKKDDSVEKIYKYS